MSKLKRASELEAHLSAQVRAHRARLGLTLRQLDAALHLATGTVSRIERGEKRFDTPTMLLLADFLKLNVDAFFVGAPNGGVYPDASTCSPIAVSEIGDFVAAYRAIDNKKARLEILALVRSVAKSPLYAHPVSAPAADKLTIKTIAS